MKVPSEFNIKVPLVTSTVGVVITDKVLPSKSPSLTRIVVPFKVPSSSTFAMSLLAKIGSFIGFIVIKTVAVVHSCGVSSLQTS